jgi:hypothetical protein
MKYTRQSSSPSLRHAIAECCGLFLQKDKDTLFVCEVFSEGTGKFNEFPLKPASLLELKDNAVV